MFINEWNGWRFECGSCCAIGRLATDLEIKELEDSQPDILPRLKHVGFLAKRSRKCKKEK